MIGVINYGTNNLGSVSNAIEYLKIPFRILNEPQSLASYKLLILPGVGSFDSGCRALHENGMFEALKNLDYQQTKILGICLGMQLLCQNSQEGKEKGLGLINATVVHIGSLGCKGKIPHVGFNSVDSMSVDTVFLKETIGHHYYFVHSYSVDVISENLNISSTEYEGATMTAAFHEGNIIGTQFHPEKSGLQGINIIKTAYEC